MKKKKMSVTGNRIIGIEKGEIKFPGCEILTSDSLSNRAKSSLRILTSSDAEYVEDIAVKPTISAYKMLEKKIY